MLQSSQRELIYRDKVEIAWADGVMSVREKEILESARSRLGLQAETAANIEAAVRAAVR